MAWGFEFSPTRETCFHQKKNQQHERKKNTPESCRDVWKSPLLQVEILQTDVGVTRHIEAIFPCSHLSSRANRRHVAAVDPGAISGSADFHRPIVWLLKAPARLCEKKIAFFTLLHFFFLVSAAKKKVLLEAVWERRRRLTLRPTIPPCVRFSTSDQPEKGGEVVWRGH